MSNRQDANTSMADDATWADALREAMVRGLREAGWIRSEPVADAFLTVPRHLFARVGRPSADQSLKMVCALIDHE